MNALEQGKDIAIWGIILLAGLILNFGICRRSYALLTRRGPGEKET